MPRPRASLEPAVARWRCGGRPLLVICFGESSRRRWCRRHADEDETLYGLRNAGRPCPARTVPNKKTLRARSPVGKSSWSPEQPEKREKGRAEENKNERRIAAPTSPRPHWPMGPDPIPRRYIEPGVSQSHLSALRCFVVSTVLWGKKWWRSPPERKWPQGTWVLSARRPLRARNRTRSGASA